MFIAFNKLGNFGLLGVESVCNDIRLNDYPTKLIDFT